MAMLLNRDNTISKQIAITHMERSLGQLNSSWGWFHNEEHWMAQEIRQCVMIVLDSSSEDVPLQGISFQMRSTRISDSNYHCLEARFLGRENEFKMLFVALDGLNFKCDYVFSGPSAKKNATNSGSIHIIPGPSVFKKHSLNFNVLSSFAQRFLQEEHFLHVKEGNRE